MSLTDGNGSGLSAADVAAVVGSNGWGNGSWGDGGWWLILLFLFAFAGSGFGGWNGGGNGALPYVVNSTTNADVQRGFDQSAVMSGISGLNSSINAISPQLCNGFASVNATVNNGFANAETAANARQIANMQQAFAAQTAVTSGMSDLASQFASCCCENRLSTAGLTNTVQSEAAANRFADATNTRDILTNQTANTQMILDKLCQLELDGVKQNYENRIAGMQAENNALQNQLTAANLAASQTAQTARILADNAAQTTALEQYLNPVPIPAYVVQNPSCCNQNYYGCGCGA